MRALVVVLAAAALVPAIARAQDPPQVCTLIGCTSGVAVNLERVSQLRGATRVTVCVNATCRRFGRSTTVARVNARGLSGEQRARVKVVVFGRNDRVLLRVVRRVALRRVQPNGRGCPPTCWTRRLTLDVTGRRLAALD